MSEELRAENAKLRSSLDALVERVAKEELRQSKAIDALVEETARMRKAAISEREACAKIAESRQSDYSGDPFDSGHNAACEGIVAAIRARGTP